MTKNTSSIKLITYDIVMRPSTKVELISVNISITNTRLDKIKKILDEIRLQGN